MTNVYSMRFTNVFQIDTRCVQTTTILASNYFTEQEKFSRRSKIFKLEHLSCAYCCGFLALFTLKRGSIYMPFSVVRQSVGSLHVYVVVLFLTLPQSGAKFTDSVP